MQNNEHPPAKRQKLPDDNLSDIGISFAKIKKRLEDSFQEKLNQMNAKHGQELTLLQNQLRHMESSTTVTALDHANLKAENESLRQRIGSEPSSVDVLERLEAVRQRKACEQEVWELRKKLGNGRTDSVPSNLTTQLSASNYDHMQALLMTEEELDAADEVVTLKNEEIRVLQQRILSMEANNQEPGCKQYQKLYYTTLICNKDGEPIFDATGKGTYLHEHAAKELKELEAMLNKNPTIPKRK